MDLISGIAQRHDANMTDESQQPQTPESRTLRVGKWVVRLVLTLGLGFAIWLQVTGRILIDIHTIIVGIAIAFLWFGPSIVKHIDILKVGGVELTLKQSEDIVNQAEKAGFSGDISISGELPVFFQIADYDINLALAGLRIELEKELVTLATERDLPDRRYGGVTGLTRSLQRANALTPLESAVILDLTHVLNRAVHGAQVDEIGGQRVLRVGTEILFSIRNRNGNSAGT